MFLLFVVVFLSCSGRASQVPGNPDLNQSLQGSWTGYLEYRDYSEPPTSTKRVQLPTWLTVSQSGDGLAMHYVYDDGPTKVVEETEQLTCSFTQSSCSLGKDSSTSTLYKVSGVAALKNGRATLVLNGAGTENKTPVEMRITITIRRNMLDWVEETRAKGSSDAFAFRHLYRFTRSAPPGVQ